MTDPGDGICPKCGGSMMNLGWLDCDLDELVCPRCDGAKFAALGENPEDWL